MNELNINEYLEKEDGDTLEASEWNQSLGAVQSKVNELVSATREVADYIGVGEITGDKIADDTIEKRSLAFDIPEGTTITQQGLSYGKLGSIIISEAPGQANSPFCSITQNEGQDANTYNIRMAQSLSGSYLNDGSVTEQKVQNGAVTENKIADSSISTDKIKNGAVTGDKIAMGTITSSKLQMGAVTGTAIANGTITGNKIADNTITADKLQMNIVSQQMSTVAEDNSRSLILSTGSEIPTDYRYLAYIDAPTHSSSSATGYRSAGLYTQQFNGEYSYWKRIGGAPTLYLTAYSYDYTCADVMRALADDRTVAVKYIDMIYYLSVASSQVCYFTCIEPDGVITVLQLTWDSSSQPEWIGPYAPTYSSYQPVGSIEG